MSPHISSSDLFIENQTKEGLLADVQNIVSPQTKAFFWEDIMVK